MKVIILLLLSAVACAKISAKEKERYLLMDELWSENATRNEVINKLGNPSEVTDQGFVYRSSESAASISSAHFFKRNGQLESQLMLISESELPNLKASLKCKWDIKKKVLSSPHTVRTVEDGKCVPKNIIYAFRSKSALYEVRWERNE